MKIVYYILIGIVFASCNSTPQKEEKMAAMPMMMMQSFETISIKKSNPLVPLKLAGELISDRETSIYAKVNSYVKKMSVDIGSTVTTGQIIMVLEAPEIQAQLAAAKSKWKAQEAIYIATKSNYDRMFKANETKGAIAKDALDQITARKLSDQAQLEAAKSAYQEIQVMNDYLIIRAPFNGIVAERNVDLGSYVGPMGKGSDKPLLVIQDNKKLRISLSIPEANTPYLKLGDSIHFKINSIPNKKYMAKISRKSGVLDFKLRSEKIEADILQTHKELKPLMVAEAMLPLQANEATFFVPKTALVESNTGIYVIRIENSLTKNIPVTKGRALADQVEVFGELNEEDKILMKATEEILEGTNIKKQKNEKSK
ncbi:efflux RND transporter periplasmic adaptor subunit [Flavobacterium plurextorum]|uniref:efflux RND transporter periplasmic adaptor subunit n=1 Tax=Flavobacterium TaxID=237 RepID=UPI00100B4CA2|nr:efflux RND transporter periplasmic adaptor subunit [Flavobacterium sp. YO12]RXM49138.1 efflux transporter periplasmic adaptor subunit [Flavobacterium sp. YO12]